MTKIEQILRTHCFGDGVTVVDIQEATQLINAEFKRRVSKLLKSIDAGMYIKFSDDPNGAGDWSCSYCAASQKAEWVSGKLLPHKDFKHYPDCIFLQAQAITDKLTEGYDDQD